MAAKFYAGSPVSGKKMDGFTFVFEAIEAISGTWLGAYTTEDAAEIAALAKLREAGQVKEISEEAYGGMLKKKAVRQRISPQMSGASEQQGVGLAEGQAPKEAVEDEAEVLEVQQVAKPTGKKKGKK